jgi:phage terminase large subunit-like protein
VPLVIELLNGTHENPGRYRVIRGSTRANRHLADLYHRTIVDMYSGTSLARQELEGELIGDVEGALLRSEQIRHLDPKAPFSPMDFPIRIVGVDPSVADRPRDECGIVVVVSTAQRDPHRRTAYVVRDESLHGSPGVWARRAAILARQYRAYVVAEDNQGGEMVRMVLRAADPDVPVTLARSEASKSVRAEPVVFAYERGQVVHADWFGEYEAQLTSWVPDESKYSPDRLDAGVIALSAALVTTPQGMGGRIRLGRPPGSASRTRRSITTRSTLPSTMVADEMVRAAYSSPTRILIAGESREQRRERRKLARLRRAAERGEPKQSPAPALAPPTNPEITAERDVYVP